MDEAWLDLVRVAKEIGNISSLFPPGIERLVDLPFHIHRALLSALTFLSFEELPKKERPPKKIWQDGKRLEAWFNEVERMRKAEIEGHGDQASWDKNPLTEQLLGRVTDA